jgi:hypothetical protein
MLNLMLHVVFSPYSNLSITSCKEIRELECQSFTRPSSFVTARKVMLDCGVSSCEGLGDSRVRTASRFEAGVPERVLRTWQVMGEEVIFKNSKRSEQG